MTLVTGNLLCCLFDFTELFDLLYVGNDFQEFLSILVEVHNSQTQAKEGRALHRCEHQIVCNRLVMFSEIHDLQGDKEQLLYCGHLEYLTRDVSLRSESLGI